MLDMADLDGYRDGQLKVTVWVTCTPHYKCVLAKLLICFVTHTHGSKRIAVVFSSDRLPLKV